MKYKKVVFVAGKFRAPNSWELEKNIRKAEELAFKVWEAGAVAICPHANTRFFDKALPDEAFLEGIREILRRCDALIVVYENWLNSEGTKKEVALARSLGIPVFLGDENGSKYPIDQLREWLVEMEYKDLYDGSKARCEKPWMR